MLRPRSFETMVSVFLTGGKGGQAIYMALIYLMRPWTSTNAENFKTSRVNNISKISKNDPIQYIYVKSVYSTPQYQKDQLILAFLNGLTTPPNLVLSSQSGV